MCGIAGFWAIEPIRSDCASAMADALHHRGPDDGGKWRDDEAGIALGHRRLAIVDLSAAGHQPMASASGRYIIVYNGEIYNHETMRAELDRVGAGPWRGHSDTEVLLAAIERWGLDEALARSVGMFALALWDRRERTLSLARDRLGEKPLYYGWTRQGLAFGSELKALLAAPGFANTVDPAVLTLYLRHNCVPAPWSILRDIYKLEPGTVLTIARPALANRPAGPPPIDGTRHDLAYRRFWSLDAAVARPEIAGLDDKAAIARVESVLTDAVLAETVADVPVGAFLSGGIDSSLIVALMKRGGSDVKTFTIGFDDPGYDEAPFAHAVACHLGTDHTEMRVGARDALDVIPTLPDIYDEPFADSSQLPTFLVSRLARTAVTVALSGDAGDELFGGYNRYRTFRRGWHRSALLPSVMRRLASAGIRTLSSSAWDGVGRLPGVGIPLLGNKAHKFARMIEGSISPSAVYEAFSQEWRGVRPTTRMAPAGWERDDPAALAGEAEKLMMYWDARGYLANDILVKVDRAAMANSLETRSPFLDHRVVELAWQLPLSFKIRDGTGKWILRQLLYRHVPQHLVERPKAGFAIPVGDWLRGPLRDWAEDLLSAKALAAEPSFDTAVIRRRWAEHLRGNDWTGSLWSVLMYQGWSRRYGITTVVAP